LEVASFIMALMFVTIEIMPESLEISLENLTQELKKIIEEKGAQFQEDRTTTQPVAFGLKALHITFSGDENKGTDEFEEPIKDLESVSSVKVINMTRAMG
jgi:translation elongation factor aEF-1 beta